jgi:hypothetical protein
MMLWTAILMSSLLVSHIVVYECRNDVCEPSGVVPAEHTYIAARLPTAVDCQALRQQAQYEMHATQAEATRRQRTQRPDFYVKQEVTFVCVPDDGTESSAPGQSK